MLLPPPSVAALIYAKVELKPLRAKESTWRWPDVTHKAHRSTLRPRRGSKRRALVFRSRLTELLTERA